MENVGYDLRGAQTRAPLQTPDSTAGRWPLPGTVTALFMCMQSSYRFTEQALELRAVKGLPQSAVLSGRAGI